jgi:hypothetical protein
MSPPDRESENAAHELRPATPHPPAHAATNGDAEHVPPVQREPFAQHAPSEGSSVASAPSNGHAPSSSPGNGVHDAAHAPHAIGARPGRLRAAEAVAALAEIDLAELWRFWCGTRPEKVPADPIELRRSVLDAMNDALLVEARVDALPKRLGGVLDALI